VDRVFFYAKAVGAVRLIVQNHAEPLATNDVENIGRKDIAIPQRAKEPGVMLSEKRAWHNH
jgi:hypothetical protein